ncbi:MAG: TetR family transcriptional regulator [Bryobacteraceae bacterium]|nr:TetR family transcriptional regulator [Bryobacteraceae bacterium]
MPETPEHAVPVRRRPVQRRGASTVEAVLRACSALLAKAPLEEINTTRIAAEAGLSVGALYRFFPDKQAIFDAVAVRHMEQFRSRMARVLLKSALRSGPALLERLMDAYIEYLEAHPDFRALALGGHISALARESQMRPGAGPAGLLREFMKRKLGLRDSAALDLRLRMAMETGERMIAYAWQQPPLERQRILGELKRMLARYLFD